MKKIQKGFTLIELLVVIAIIGILATIVLTSLGSARGKANDAKVQAQLSSMRAQAELYYSDHGNYGAGGTDCSAAVFTDGSDSLAQLLAGISSDYTTTCYTNPTSGSANAWAVTSENSDSTTEWCADSNGDSKVYNAGSTPAIGSATVVNALCP